MTEDSLLGGHVRLLQSESGLRATTDTVFLAAACPVGETNAQRAAPPRILDLGCGSGGAGLCVLARAPQATLTGVDIQADLIGLATRNATLNMCENRARFICADIRNFEPESDSFDYVICNPPYLEAGAHTASPDVSKARASGFLEDAQDGAGLKDWLDCAFRCLNGRGSLTLIHRADALDRILQGLGRRFGAVEIIPLWPGAGKPASRVIVRARPNRRTGVILHAGVIMHDLDGCYTIDAGRILRSPCRL
ncbi:MAG: methyltransferase domain-containing protein [Rhodospirillales bacterium]|nr:methyltransferase domain-containing protein [Rhodospirillales bacterium]